MNKSSFLVHSFFLLCSATLFCGKPFAEPTNISSLKKQLIQYHDSGEYYREIQKITQQVESELLLAKKNNPQQKLALVLDIDETCLSNFNSIVARDFSGNLKRIHQDTLKAEATTIKPSLHLFNTALAQHIDVFFISGRFENERQATIKNLHAAGFKGWKALILQPDSNYGTANTIEKFKISARQKLSEKGYKIIASVGDQYADLLGGYTKITYKLPNPFYETASSKSSST